MDEATSLEPMRPLRIFVVEDDPEMQKAYRLYFEAHGHTVSAAFSVGYALERLARVPYDVLIVDIGLPGTADRRPDLDGSLTAFEIGCEAERPA